MAIKYSLFRCTSPAAASGLSGVGLGEAAATGGGSLEFSLPRPNSTQGDLVSRRADPPSQDRRSLGYLVSSPPLATDHESRLHQLAGDVALQPQSGEGQRVDR